MIDRWKGLKDSDNETINSALLGILRHLPDEIAGDIEEIKNELDLESPLENLDQALEDISLSVAEIASVTRGFVPRAKKPKTEKPNKNNRPCNARTAQRPKFKPDTGTRSDKFKKPR